MDADELSQLLNGRAGRGTRASAGSTISGFCVATVAEQSGSGCCQAQLFAGLDRAQAAGPKLEQLRPAKEAEALVQSNATDSEN